MSGAFATCILEFADEVIPSWDVLFELAESEETAVDHPEWTPRWIGLDTVLQLRRLGGYDNDIQVRLHIWIRCEGFIRIDALQKGLRESVSIAEAASDLINTEGYQTVRVLTYCS